MTKTLITGGTGFIGRAVVELCLKNDENVTVLDNDSRGSIQKLSHLKNQFRYISGDIRDPELIIEATRDADRVIHLAYINGTEYFYSKPYDILEVGVKGILNILDAHRINGFKELIVASTSETYQNAPVIPTPESTPLVIPDVLNPRFSYGGGKIATELLAINYAKQNDLVVKVFRPHNVYGPDMGNEHVVPQLIEKIQKSRKTIPQNCLVEIQGSGNETRSFCYIKDFISALQVTLEDKANLGIYHLGVNDEVSILDLTSKIASIMQTKIEIKTSSLLKGSPLRRCPDISKIERLGFRQEWTLEMGLEETVQWYLQK
jgi:nucleoside-diphosphate-sugar epimerase